VRIPEWGVARIRAKIDTGARSCAIHVGEIEELDGGRVRFEVILRERPTLRSRWVEAALVREAVVKPSSGERQVRPVVRTVIEIAGLRREVDIGLVCRKGMLCRMLVGRSALQGLFAVDSSRKYLAGDAPHKRGGSSV
jgi:hypothetical protein